MKKGTIRMSKSFIAFLEKKMNDNEITQSLIAIHLKVTQSAVSQFFKSGSITMSKFHAINQYFFDAPNIYIDARHLNEFIDFCAKNGFDSNVLEKENDNKTFFEKKVNDALIKLNLLRDELDAIILELKRF